MSEFVNNLYDPVADLMNKYGYSWQILQSLMIIPHWCSSSITHSPITDLRKTYGIWDNFSVRWSTCASSPTSIHSPIPFLMIILCQSSSTSMRYPMTCILKSLSIAGAEFMNLWQSSWTCTHYLITDLRETYYDMWCPCSPTRMHSPITYFLQIWL